jgi:hypothetical protein
MRFLAPVAAGLAPDAAHNNDESKEEDEQDERDDSPGAVGDIEMRSAGHSEAGNADDEDGHLAKDAEMMEVQHDKQEDRDAESDDEEQEASEDEASDDEELEEEEDYGYGAHEEEEEESNLEEVEVDEETLGDVFDDLDDDDEGDD